MRTLALAAALLVAVPAFAAEGGLPRSVVDLSLEELMEIPVFAASRREQSLAEAPARVSVVGREEIRAYGYRTLVELLAALPGLYASSDRAYDYIGVRGFGRPGDYNSRVLLLVDGLRLNEEVYGSAPLGTDFPLDLDLVEKVEVVRGPASSLYGSNAFLAVVNVVTRRARDLHGLEARGGAGSREAADGRLSYGAVLRGGAAELLLSAAAGRDAGRDWRFAELDAPETNGGLAEGIDGQEWASLLASGRAGGWTLEALYGVREKDVPTAAWGTIFNDPGHTVRDARLLLGLGYERALGPEGMLSAQLSWQLYRYRGTYPFDWAAEGEPPQRVINRDRSAGDWGGAELRYVTEALPHGTLNLGVEYRDLYRVDQDNRDDGVTPANLESRESGSAFGAYVQDEVRLGDAALLNVGARYDRVGPREQERLSPRLGVIVRPGAGTTVKLLYGEAFRAPNAYELYYGDGISMKGNPGLGVEEIRSYEIGLEQALGERVAAKLSAYRWSIRGLIDQTLDPEDGLLVFRNLGHAEALGGEAEIRYRAPGRFEMRASYAYAEAESSDTGERLSNSPRHLGALRASAPLVPDLLRAAVEARYVGERGTVRGGSVGAALPVALTLAAGRSGGRWELGVSVRNLFDASYESPVGAEHAQDAIAQEGRTIRVAVTGRF